MRTKQEALDRFGDEICGLLLEAFAEAEARHLQPRERAHEDEAIMGRAMLRRMRRGREFIEKVCDFLASTDQPKTPPVPANGAQPQPSQRKVGP